MEEDVKPKDEDVVDGRGVFGWDGCVCGLGPVVDSSQTPATYPECLFCVEESMGGWRSAYVECHMDTNISKSTTGKERIVASCAESQSTSGDPNRTRFLNSTDHNARQDVMW